MKVCLIASLLFLIFTSVRLVADTRTDPCARPDYSDPDERMDNIGRKDFCQYFDPDSTYEQRQRTVRENLGSGMLNSDQSSNSDGARGVEQYGDWYYVTGRVHNGTNNDFGLMRYFFDGSLDTSFDTDGKATYSFGTGDDVAYGIAIATSGGETAKIIVAGRTDKGVADAFDFAILRVLTSGKLDTSFHTDGRNTADGGSSKADFARAVKWHEPFLINKIIVAGYGKNTNYEFLLMRFKTDGSLDTTFNTNGINRAPVGSSDAGALAIEILTSDNLTYVAAGNAYNGSNWDFAAVRIRSDGRIDTAFDTDGKYVLDFTGSQNDSAYAVKATSNRYMLVGATNNGANLDFAAARLLTSGAIDTSFHTDGKVGQAVLSGDDAAFAVGYNTNALQMIAAGYAYNGSNNDFAVVRFKSDGTLDTTFSTSGKMTRAVLAAEDTAQSIFLKMDNILVGGRTYNGSNLDFALMRLNTDGSLAGSATKVKSFGANGLATVDMSDGGKADRPLSVILNTNVLYVAGKATASGELEFSLLALDLTGNPGGISGDPYMRFDVTSGVGNEKAVSLTMDTTNNLVILCGDTVETSAKLLAVNADGGTVEPAFGTSGVMNAGTGGSIDRCLSVWTPDVGGFAFVGLSDAARGFNASFYRTDDAGNWDSGFDSDGHVKYGTDIIGQGGGARIPSSDYYLSVGIDTLNYYVQMVSVHRNDGTLDAGFATSGIFYNVLVGGGSGNFMSDGKVVVLDSSGKIYIAFANNQGGTDRIYSAKFTATGDLDTTFHTDGNSEVGPSVSDDVSSNITLQANEKPVRTYFAGSAFGLIRYTIDGRLDTTFATDGSYASSTTGTPSSIITIPGLGWICTPGSDRTAGDSEDTLVECVWP